MKEKENDFELNPTCSSKCETFMFVWVTDSMGQVDSE